jgi:propane monooxygenase coupling protein
VTTQQQFKHPESPFKANNTASNKCGFTLMNNQVGEVVAQVMATKPNVTVTWLPSMMRVDATGRMDVVYDEISEALGEEPGFFDAAEFEENMSTHYGRMIHEDDRTIMFANPEDAAEYIGFDLTPASN